MAGGKVQFLSCKDETIQLINEGYTYKQIYTAFLANGKITISYNVFCLLLKKYGIYKLPESAFARMTEDIRNEIHLKKENYKKYGLLHGDQEEFRKTNTNRHIHDASSSTSKNDDDHKTEIKQINEQTSPASQQIKPLFEIKRLGDEAFE